MIAYIDIDSISYITKVYSIYYIPYVHKHYTLRLNYRHFTYNIDMHDVYNRSSTNTYITYTIMWAQSICAPGRVDWHNWVSERGNEQAARPSKLNPILLNSVALG